MRYLIILSIIICGPFTTRADETAYKEAQTRLLKGNYSEAQAGFAKLLSNGKFAVKARVGLSRAWRSVGEYEKAAKVLDDGLKLNPRSGALWGEKADLLFLRGQWEKAEKAAKKSIDNETLPFRAKWVLARLYQSQGKLDESINEMRWFLKTYQSEEFSDPLSLMLVGEAAVELAREDKRRHKYFQFVLTNIWGWVANNVENYWPASYARAGVFHEKSRWADAEKNFTRALVINPRAAPVHVARGYMALERFRMKAAETAAKVALNINPRSAEALRLKADIYLAAADTKRALEQLEKARKVNPRSEKTLAAIATCHFLDNEMEKFQAILDFVDKQNSKAGWFYHELAGRLDQRKRFDQARKYFEKAVELRPKMTPPQNSLGLLYMRLGEEELARKQLETAFEIDNFNVRVKNTLDVLDHLEKYQDLKTKHFLIRYDKNNDDTLARVVGKYLEEIYDEYAKEFDYRPKGPILIEIFNNHEMFSGRVIALPDLHTIGACTGKMFAMVSPKDKLGVISKPFNWNRVIRHEMVHIFNLAQTKFQCPHWFTEGLAVRAEKNPMPPLWRKLLVKRLQSGKLLNLDNIHLGFIRPANGEEWNLAYLQSKLYVDYLRETHGQEAIAGMLEAYAKTMDTGPAIEKVCGVKKSDFEKGYQVYLKKVAKDLGADNSKKPPTFDELQAKYAKNSNDPDVAATLAERYYSFANRKRAKELSEEALKLKEGHSLGSYVKALMLLENKKDEEALKVLEAGFDPESPNLKVAKKLGMIYFKDKMKITEAAEIFELGRKQEPFDLFWLGQLARCYRELGDDEKLLSVLEDYAPLNADDFESRKYLALLHLKAGDYSKAQRWAKESLEIDVTDQIAQAALLKALKEQNKDEERAKWAKVLKGE
ncbi:MAG: tetratricopeptide repeat protein [Gemmataceae bacterium]